MASPEAIAMKEKTDFPQDLPSPLFASMSVTRLKSLQTPEGEVQSMTHDEAHHIPKELLEISNLYKRKSGDHVWEWMLKV